MDAGDPDRVPSLADGPEIEQSVLGSRFLAQAFGVDGEEQIRLALDSVRRRYHDATHHCWAYRLSPDLAAEAESRSAALSAEPEAPQERWNDDGEPSGSAGVPILGSLQRPGLTNAVVVVTRYFGGRKLGTGGLVRAYGAAAREAVAAAPTRELWKLETLRAACEYGDLGTVEAVLARSGEALHKIERTFSQRPEFALSVVRSKAAVLRAALIEATAGRISFLP